MMLKPNIVAPMEPVLVDQRFEICVENLQPFQRFTMRAELNSEKGAVYESYGHFMADSTGTANLNKDPSFGGSYTGTDCMGLFWSMVPAPNQRKGLRYTPRNIETPTKYEIQLFDGHVTADSEKWNDEAIVASKTVLRTYLAPYVERREISVGRIRGSLFLPKQRGKFPGVIDVPGRTGGLEEHRAALLASHGFATLALACFAYKDLPTDSNEVELEYFFEAVEWLSKHQRVYSNGIGFVGLSYGGQIGLQVAAECRLIKAVVAISSPSFVYNAIKYHNELIGFTFEVTEEDVEIHDGCVVSKGMADKHEDFIKENQIKIENISAEIMIITGEEDQSLRAVELANQMKERLREKKSNKRIVHLSYPNTGHLIEPPYMQLCNMSYHKAFKYFWAWGGHAVEHNAAQEHAWKSIIAFLNQNLVENSKL